MVSTRSRTNSGSSSAAELPQKRSATADASKRPAKKPTTAASDLAVGKSVTTDVTLVNQEEKEVVIADTFRDQGVVFFMYPRANTPGCTKQACGFRDNIQTIKDAGFTVYGLSGDSPKSLTNWKTKQSLPFDLLSDPEHKLISYFGSSLPGNKVQRSHVVILKGGVVGDIAAKVSPADSVSRAVEFVKKSSGAEAPKEDEPTKEEEPTDTEKFAVGNTVTFDGELQTDASATVKVQDLFKTRGAIFFMYPKADTPGCTTQACGYNDNLEAINAAGFDLLAWKESQKYKYTFLSDPKHQLIGYFGSSINDGTRVERSHVIVLPGGKVGQIEHNISPQDSVSKGLEFAKSHTIDAASKFYRNWFPSDAETPMRELVVHSIDEMDNICKQTNNALGLNRNGYLFVTQDAGKMEELKRLAKNLERHGGGELRVHEPNDKLSGYRFSTEEMQYDLDGSDLLVGIDNVAAAFPNLKDSFALAALHVRRCGSLNPVKVANYELNKAVEYCPKAEVLQGKVTDFAATGGNVSGVKVAMHNGDTLEVATPKVVFATGPLFESTLEMLKQRDMSSFDVPIINELHCRAIVDDVDRVLPPTMPLTFDSDPMGKLEVS
ncbi:hypothetical protein AM588_10006402 [Phytophthora nicotianae]|uniref:thioredoxin-dependent peroxiredoxin n=1 Tax=Phytophthora nicotianae TaxID=4792 RepID=A0A0W8D9G5_PHYNI|nr:hypothetical protein AM588_10006402 [Phytophthora nicotianae]